jgi:hypothetical protein
LEKKRKVRRKSFAAREDYLNEMNKIAKENGLSLYGFVNQVFVLILRANELGVNINTLIDSREVLKSAKENGFTLGLERLWYEMAELAYTKSEKAALRSWFDTGVWFAKRYVTGEDADPFEAFKNDLQEFTWNIPELKLTKKKAGKVSVRVVSPRFTEAYTFLFASFIEGALEAFGYEIDCKEVSRGMVRLEAVRNGCTNK